MSADVDRVYIAYCGDCDWSTDEWFDSVVDANKAADAHDWAQHSEPEDERELFQTELDRIVAADR